jgi:type I restriction enzyme S subunit
VISRNSISGAFPIRRLGEVVDFLDSKRRPVTASERKAGPFPYYGANGLQGTIDEFIFDEPLVLLAEDGGHFDDPARGIAYRISGKTWVNNHAHVLRPTSNVDLAYLCRVLENYNVKPFVTGTTRGKLTKAGASEIPIPLPPLAEQRRIAEVLDKAEALRAKRRAALAQLESLTQSLFLDLFGDPMKNERGWTLPKVGVAGRVQLGRQRAPKYQSGKHTRPYVRVANVYEDRLDLSDVLSMDFDNKDFKAYRLEYGDILLNEGQSTELVGRAAMWRNEIADCCFQNTLVRFQSNRETTLPEFALALFLNYFRTGEFAKISSKTSNVAHLGAARFAAMPFPLPPLDLQREFARRVATVEKLKTAQRAALAELDALFSSLQHRAFRGEL